MTNCSEYADNEAYKSHIGQWAHGVSRQIRDMYRAVQIDFGVFVGWQFVVKQKARDHAGRTG